VLCQDELHNHFHEAHATAAEAMTYREAVFAITREQLPQAVSSSIWKRQMSAYCQCLTQGDLQERPCHCCAQLVPPEKLRELQIPHADDDTVPPWWGSAQHDGSADHIRTNRESWRVGRKGWERKMANIFSVSSYLVNFFCVTQRLEHARLKAAEDPDLYASFPERVQRWKDALGHWMAQHCPLSPFNDGARWVWLPSTDAVRSNAELCRKCYGSLARPIPEMLLYAMANGMWGGPVPRCLAELSWMERKVIAEARVCCFLRRSTAPTKVPQRVRQKYHSGNVVCFMQEPRDLIGAFALLPEALGRTVYVQFVGADQEALKNDPTLQVAPAQLERAFVWLATHCYEWLSAAVLDSTGAFALCGRLQKLLDEYSRSIGHRITGVPREILSTATPLSKEQRAVASEGPADLAGEHEGSTDTAHGKDEGMPQISAAVLDDSLPSLSPIKLWGEALKSLVDATKTSAACAQKRCVGSTDEHAFLQEKSRVAMTNAFLGLKELSAEHVQQTIRDHASKCDVAIKYNHTGSMLSFFDPLFFQKSFPVLFPLYDCGELEPQRKAHGNAALQGSRWSKCLLKRWRGSRWRLDLEFMAVCFNVFLRRSQMTSLAITYRKPWFTSWTDKINSVKASDVRALAQIAEEHQSIKSIMRSDDVAESVKFLLHKMQLVQRYVPYTDAFRQSMRNRFTAMRIWGGSSTIFWTINPADVKHEMTLTFSCGDVAESYKYNLDWHDAEKNDFLDNTLPDLAFHEIVATDPVAAVSFYDKFLELMLIHLFNMTTKPKHLHPDGVAGHEAGGIAGVLASYIGMTEPQARESLHFHFLTTAVGLENPERLRRHFARDFQGTVLTLWKWAASIQFCSTEAAAVHMDGGDAEAGQATQGMAMETLRSMPLLQIDKDEQLPMIGLKGYVEQHKAQCMARGLPPTTLQAFFQDNARFLRQNKGRPYLQAALKSRRTSPEEWQRRMVTELLLHTKRCGNHKCKPRVCHKGRIGKKGFCRLGFWHYALRMKKGTHRQDRRKVQNAKDEPKRVMVHGKSLVPRWDGQGMPPIEHSQPDQGRILFERNHPFHTKMNPPLGVCGLSNHDVNHLLRLQVLTGDPSATDPAEVERRVSNAIADMSRGVNDANWHTHAYVTKQQPHLVNLFKSFGDGLEHLQKDFDDALANGVAQESPEYTAKRIIFRLMSKTNSVMHKGLPEIVAFLLGLHELRCSHAFGPLYAGGFLKYATLIWDMHLGKRIPTDERESFTLCMESTEGVDDDDGMVGDDDKHDSEMESKKVMRNARLDYMFRPERFEDFPLYFFWVGTVVLKENQSFDFLEQFFAEAEFTPTEQQSLPKRHPWHGSHGVALVTDKAWKVPCLESTFIPDVETKPFEHCLLLSLLFRPWRSVTDTFFSACSSEGDFVKSFLDENSLTEIRSNTGMWKTIKRVGNIAHKGLLECRSQT